MRAEVFSRRALPRENSTVEFPLVSEYEKGGGLNGGIPLGTSPTRRTGEGSPINENITVATITTVTLLDVDRSHKTFFTLGPNFPNRAKIASIF